MVKKTHKDKKKFNKKSKKYPIKKYGGRKTKHFRGGCETCGVNLMKGGCGCSGNSFHQQMTGGDFTNKMSFDGSLSSKNYYSFNDHILDPNDPSHQIDTRLTPQKINGGKQNKKTNKLRKYQIKGGNLFTNTPFGSDYNRIITAPLLPNIPDTGFPIVKNTEYI
jgi:hypothetical protein